MALLVIEDDDATRNLLEAVLTRAGFDVESASTLAAAHNLVAARSYEVILLDLQLPDGNGMQFLQELRGKNINTHVLILTATEEAAARVHGLDAGADDFVAKSAPHPELEARVRALIRRKYGAKNPCIVVEDLEVDTISRDVRRAGQSIPLTAREFELLALLARRAGEVVSRAQIWKDLYGMEGTNSNVIDVYIGYLRRKIDGPGQKRLIHTRRGIGFRLGP